MDLDALNLVYLSNLKDESSQLPGLCGFELILTFPGTCRLTDCWPGVMLFLCTYWTLLAWMSLISFTVLSPDLLSKPKDNKAEAYISSARRLF